MNPSDGYWGVAERIVLLPGNESIAKINKEFPSQTKLNETAVLLEHRRADCNLQVAYLFDLAGSYFKNKQYKLIANNIINFV